METIKVIEKTTWRFAKSNCGEGGLIGQVTKCRFDGITFYVRENVNGIDSFLISSGERLGDKTGKNPVKSRQVLELFAPKKFWPFLMKKIAETDSLKRPVFPNKKFNKKFIQQVFNNTK